VPGGWTATLLSDMDAALDATSRVVVACGVLNIWLHEAKEAAAWMDRTRGRAPGRVLLGLGVSHEDRVIGLGRRYTPMAAMRGYLDALDGADPPVAVGERVLGALGPRMLELARNRAAGVHTYMVDPAHTARARALLGPDRLIVPEVKVVLDADRTRALETARAHIDHYLKLPNYTANLLRLGYLETDFADGGSERLVDGLFAVGDVGDVRRRVSDHHAAGAQQVCVQVVSGERAAPPWAAWRELAAGLADL
jgi:probable F420-dependent oxidoreductase